MPSNSLSDLSAHLTSPPYGSVPDNAEDEPDTVKNGTLTHSLKRQLRLADPSSSANWKGLTDWWEKEVDHPSVERVQKEFIRHVISTLARAPVNLDTRAAYQALALTIRDHLILNWNKTQAYQTSKDPKRVYYLSMEFLLGRSLGNAVLNLDISGVHKSALKQLGFKIEDLMEQEYDAALGNGGLGRLAACFMDSLASLDYPAWGYGLRYTYGIFQQRITPDGFQMELPDYWLNYGNVWELPRLDVVYDVRFYGESRALDSGDTSNDGGVPRFRWTGGELVQAVAYDVPIPGFRTSNTINIRLWRSVPKSKFDLASFNQGDYQKSVEENIKAENITSVLYPNDNTIFGKELRLKQQYFFVCATLQDILRRFQKKGHAWSDLPNYVAIQLNDTHPTLGIVELQRILVDIHKLQWDDAWSIVTKVYSFTNHTVLPEAMEKWSVPMLENLLPRHMQIIYDINLFFLQNVEKKFPGDRGILERVSIIEEGSPQHVRMAYLAVMACHTVNGVAAIHSELIKQTIFKDFVTFFGPDKFQNKTNGITPRRWLHQANPELSSLISEKLGGDEWLKDLDQLQNLRQYADDSKLQERWMQVKYHNKVKLAEYIRENHGIDVDPASMFDVQVKRLHEYKRQFMNILGVVYRYLDMKSKLAGGEELNEVPRVVMFGGKAAPGYHIAKLVIKLINTVAQIVNNDESTNKYLKVVFLADYNVSLAEIIIPASDISQHISTAGTEASGTSNMKFVLNGGMILGTHDGANIEIMQQIGEENIFMFGNKAEKVNDIRHNQRFRKFSLNQKLEIALKYLYSLPESKVFTPLLETLTKGGDFYLVSADFAEYLDAQKMVDDAWKRKKEWARRSILCTAGMGMFSSDRTISQYAKEIWNINPCKISD